MKITNRHGLPRTLVNLAERDDYSRGEARLSVTQLIGPPRISILKQRHHHEIERDVSDMLWALVGRAIHHICEAGSDEEHIPEERCFATIEGWVLSGAMDVQRKQNVLSIIDYKFTGAWNLREVKPEWERQLNCYAWLLREAKDLEVQRLEVCAFIRDWSRKKSERDPSYPVAPVQVVPVVLWDRQRQTDYVISRIRLHQEAARASAWQEELVRCTDEERWLRGEAWAVMKPGRKRAVSVHESEWLALKMAGQAGATVEHRPGEYVRCNNYCEVAQWCSTHQRWLKESKGE